MQLNRTYKLLIFCLVLILNNLWLKQAGAQSSQYQLFNESRGLNRHSIFDIVKDENGFYWLGTEKGIIRFDGANFIEIPTPKPYTYEIVKKLYQYKNFLYIIYSRQGCVRLDLKNYSFKVITDLNISGAIHIDDNTVVLTEKKGTIFTYDGNSLKAKFYLDVVQNDRNMIIKNGLLFIHYQDNGIYVFDPSSFKLKKIIKNPTLQIFIQFLTHKNKLYAIGNFEYHEITPDLELKKVRDPIYDENQITYLAFDNEEHQYYINRSKLIFRRTGEHSSLIDMSYLENVELRKILVHDEKNILVSTNIGLLLIQTSPPPVDALLDKSINTTNQLRIRRKIIPLSNEEFVLFGYSINYRYNKGKLTPIKMQTASSYDAVRVGDQIYFTTEDNGVYAYKISKNKVDKFTDSILMKYQSTYGIGFGSKDSILLIGAKNRLIYKSLKTNEVRLIKMPINFSFMQTIVYDSIHEKYWLGTDSGAICLNRALKPIKVIRKMADQSKILDVTEILLHDQSKEVWIAHRYGIDIIDAVNYKNIKQLTESFFDNPVIASLVEDKNGRIWIPTYEGLYGYDPKKDARLRLGGKNLLSNTEYNLKSFCILPNGKMIFGGLTGYDIIDPAKFTFNKSSDIGRVTGYERITSDTSEFKPLADQISTIQFDIDKESIRIYLAAKGEVDARYYRYEYRLNNEGWISLKDASFINIYKLDPGLYKLQIRGYDEFGTIINFKPVYINATVVFYKNRYFIWALFMLSLALVILVVWNEIRRKQIESTIKEKISMDLHDEVGTILTRALMIANSKSIAKKEDRIKDYLSEALYSLRVYINTMNKESFSLYQLSDEMKEMISKSFTDPAYNVSLNLKIESDFEVKSEKYRDMKLCLFEIVNNILKHSNGKNINITLEATPLLIRFLIQDDGNLTDVKEIEEKGNGIRNIRKRVKKHKGIANFAIPENGHGLEINLICPQ